jgi:hypothetical protein
MEAAMKKSVLAYGIGIALGLGNITASAALVDGSVLTIGNGSFFTLASPGTTTLTNPGFDGQYLSNNNGLIVGTAQSASGSHAGTPNGTEMPGIDAPFVFFGNTGMHFSSSPSQILSASGNSATIDMSGWGMEWDGVTIPLSTGAWAAGTSNGVATVTCGVDCSVGDSYTLAYSATLQPGNPSNISDIPYYLKLTGTVAAVPLPASFWLLATGLAGVFGWGRRRHVIKHLRLS